MSAIIDLLREEHRSLARLLKALEHQLEVFDRGEVPDYEVFSGVLDYCQTYSDRYHHPKEDLVFERLRQRNPAAVEAFGDLEAEHVALTESTRRLAAAVTAVLAEAEIPRANFDSLARNFLADYWAHMSKEEEVFFPAALDALSDDDWKELDARVTSPEDPLFGGAAEERFGPLRAHLLAWDAETKAAED
ncbi:MAG: hemerythrin domain-containing protein [Kiloniellales bacterium]|nr:hemerythrin domain-containing protein [Kiloniellales bacterium]